MSWKSILQEYALNIHPERLPPSVRLTHTSRTIAIFDKFNKAKYHLLLLPRPAASWGAFELVSLKRVLQSDKVAAKELLEMLREESEPVIRMIQDEMVRSGARKGTEKLTSAK
jgi:aprataxin